ncbi:hypothetical protein CO641_04040 [Lysobacteraceae bacterium NML91-0213]|nr:hypothetical protein CO641_04040 [Xanthomonadaceae bacterium NML91-0213]
MSNDASQQAFAAAAAEFDAMARRFWGAWSEALQPATAQGNAFGQAGFASGAHGMPGFGASVAGLPGFGPAGVAGPMNWWAGHAQAPAAQQAASRFEALARQWYAQMQQLVAGFAGREGSAGDIVEAWKQLLANAGGDPFAQMLATAQQQAGSLGPQAWLAQASPWLQRMQGGAEWLQTPTFGFAREHQERWQRLAQAQIDLQQKMEAYNALMARVTQDGLVIFERKLAERESPGLQIDSPRALFDLWIDAAEEAYAPVALGEEFRHVYAALVDAQMRVRQAVQHEVELVCALFDMPTRSELDGAHRKVVELERQVRRLRDAVAALTGGSGGRPGAAVTGNAGSAAAGAPARAGSVQPASASESAGRMQAKTTSRAATPARTRGTTRAAAGPATGGAVPRGSKVAAGGGAAGGKAAKTSTRAATGNPGKPSARKAAATKRPRREVAAEPARQGQRMLFSPAHATPTAPKPLKKGKR